MNILEKILTVKGKEVAVLRASGKYTDDFVNKNSIQNTQKKSFAQVLHKTPNGSPALIAEIKRASPSAGVLNENVNPVALAQVYEASGAAAISVLTDETFFQGSIHDLESVAQAVSIPVLRKDFIFTPEQIREAAAHNASAVLLMVSVVRESSALRALMQEAKTLGMDALVEIHTEEELSVALEAGAEIIGVNARSFDDLSVDIARTKALLPRIPQGIIRVAESGINTPQDAAYLAPHADAFLIGTSLMKQGMEGVSAHIQHLFSRKNHK